jgi:flagellin-like hook-associated protein FlgL
MRMGNVPAGMIAQRMFNANLGASFGTMRTLATGFRITRGSDDPAGLISSEALRGALMSLDAESRSLARADALVSAADGAMGEISDLLVEAEGLAVEAANTGGLTPEERAAKQQELDSILQTVDRLGAASFAGRNMFDGKMSVMVGEDAMTLSKISSRELGLADVAEGGSASLDGGDPEAAAEAIRAARSKVSEMRGSLGAFQKDAIAPRLRAISIASENTAAAVSMIRDTDYAAATADLARQRVLTGAAGRMLRLSSQASEEILNLLG